MNIDRLRTNRAEAFSDGVFAIAITLLVLTLHVPDHADIDSHGSLHQALLSQWPSYLAYVTAFLTIGVTWLNHHGVFAKIDRVDGTTQLWNLALLLVVALAPFPTELLAGVFSDRLTGEPARTAALLFIVVSAVRPAIWALLWGHLRRHTDLLVDRFDAAYARREQGRAAVGCAFYMVGLATAFLVPVASVAVALVIAVFYALTAHGAGVD